MLLGKRQRTAQRETVGHRRLVGQAMLGLLSVGACWREIQVTPAVPAAEVRFEKAGRHPRPCVADPQARLGPEVQAVAEAPEAEVAWVAAGTEGLLLPLLLLHLLPAPREVRFRVEEGQGDLLKPQRTGEREERSGQVQV